MGELLAYSIKSAVILSVLFSIYMLTLSRIKGAALRRTTLLAIYFASLLLPLLNLSQASSTKAIGITEAELTTPVHNIVLPLPETTPLALQIITMITLVGMAILLIHSLFGISSILLLRLKGRTVNYDGIKLTVVKNRSISPFCFGGRIYISEEEYADMSEMVITHETSHIRHLHFLDLILARTVLILQWWNPLSWLMLKELHEVHEFQADSDVLNNGFNPTDYQYLLLTRASGKSNFSFGNSLGQSKLKNRLKMINREESGVGRKLAGLLILPGALISIMILSTPLFASMISSATNVNFSSPKEPSLTTAFSPIDAINLTSKDTLSGKEAVNSSLHNKGNVVEYKEEEGHPDILLDGGIVAYEDLSSIDPSQIESITVRKDSPEHPNGLIIINMKSKASYTDINKEITPTKHYISDTIGVISYGAIKKY